MRRFLPIAFLLLALLPAALPANSGTRPGQWQEGEILSRKTVLPGNHGNRTRYVYRIRSGNLEYTVRFDQPLSAAPYVPLKFSVNRKHMVVKDADGSELRAAILNRSGMTIRK